MKEKNLSVVGNNNSKIEEKVKEINEKSDKYTQKYERTEKEKFDKQYETKNNIYSDGLYRKTCEIKAKFYDPVSSISTNKGFTFGLKLFPKDKPKDGADFSTLEDDFEKLIRFNKKYQHTYS